MAGTYLEDNPPRRTQYRNPRRAAVTGGVVLHTAESMADLVGPDLGAENVAAFIANRSDAAGSYHTIVDADSIVRLVPYQWEAFHDGTGSNRYSLGLSWACRASWWPELMRGAWGPAAIENGARAAADMASWVLASQGIVIPARHITAEQFRAGSPGFVSHGELDPGRRYDPGPGFPWDLFLDRFAFYTAPITEEPDLEYHYNMVMADVDELYLAYRGHEPSPGERQAWGQDIARKLFVDRVDIIPTLEFINHALSNERKESY